MNGETSQLMAWNRQKFDFLLDLASREFQRGQLQQAALLGQVAANWAWHHHPGFFSSARLEHLLMQIGQRLNTAQDAGDPPGVLPRESVLHVMTESYAVGGHTRLATRWIGLDSRKADLVLTQHHRGELPEDLVAAVTATGGQVHDLSQVGGGGFLERAGQLRRLARQHRFVVLHVHPYDALPLLALSDLESSVIFVNHADHVFWIGAGISHTVMNFRESGQGLTVERRGVPSEQTALLPLPLDISAATATADLPVQTPQADPPDPHRKTVLSVASGYKYGDVSTGDNPYVNMLVDLASLDKDFRALIVGPAPTGVWAQAETLTGGRVRALGIRRDLAALHAQADLYLDSFPFTSVTSFLEAALSGLPVVTLAPREHTDVFAADDPDLSPWLVRAESVGALRQSVLFLLDHPAERRAVGAASRQALVQGRDPQAWRDNLETVYTRAAVLPVTVLRERQDETPSEVDHLLTVMQDSSARMPFGRIWWFSSEFMPLQKRLGYAAQFVLCGNRLSPLTLLSWRQALTLRDMKKNALKFWTSFRSTP